MRTSFAENTEAALLACLSREASEKVRLPIRVVWCSRVQKHNKPVHYWKSEAKSRSSKREGEETPSPGTTLRPNSKLSIFQPQHLAAVKGNDKWIRSVLGDTISSLKISKSGSASKKGS